MFRASRPRPRVVVGVPSGITDLERRAVRASAAAAGAAEVLMVSDPMAAAIGVGLPVDAPTAMHVARYFVGRVIMGEMPRIDIGEHEKRNGTRIDIDARIALDSSVILSGCNRGPAVEEMWGDEDYEYWVTVPAEEKDQLLLALLRDRFRNNPTAVISFKEWLEREAISYRFEIRI